MEKNGLREIALKKRRELSIEDKTEKNAIIKKRLMPYLDKATVVGIYVNKFDEVETISIIEELLVKKKRVVVPKTIKKAVVFVEITSLDELEKGCFDVLEPKCDCGINLSEVDLMVVPMVGFDSLKQRIGYGGGYYDSVLDKVDCQFIGLAYAVQQVENFITDPHDIAMDVILTEYTEF